MMTVSPRITFGIIVLNGEPFLRYTLRALYPFAHEIIVVEGAAPGAKNIASGDGHSHDSTLATLHDFKAKEDPDDKLTIVTRDGFWTEKDEMSQAYAERATGDYLWQVDVDEFYQPADMQAVIDLLRADPSITAVSFNTITFWGAPNYRVDAWHHRRGAAEYHRLFKWGADYRYTTHRPPTVVDGQGTDLRDLKRISGTEMESRGIKLYHYSLLLPKQVLEKCEYYSQAEWAKRENALRWAQDAYLSLGRPYHLHNVDQYPGCLFHYTGDHPPQLKEMWRSITATDSPYETRATADIEALLRSCKYQIGRALVMSANQPSLWLRRARIWLKARIAQCLPRRVKDAMRRR